MAVGAIPLTDGRFTIKPLPYLESVADTGARYACAPAGTLIVIQTLSRRRRTVRILSCIRALATTRRASAIGSAAIRTGGWWAAVAVDGASARRTGFSRPASNARCFWRAESVTGLGRRHDRTRRDRDACAAVTAVKRDGSGIRSCAGAFAVGAGLFALGIAIAACCWIAAIIVVSASAGGLSELNSTHF